MTHISKLAMIGGGGVRTPLVVHGLAQSQSALGLTELALYDVDRDRTEMIANIGREVVRRLRANFRITVSDRVEDAVAGAAVVVSSIRVGGIAARARDERIAIEHGLAGQETTGPGGAAMALRTIPVTLEHARTVERVAPNAWFINFTNPAGLITQALSQNTGLRVMGICDTPIELFHRIAWALDAPYDHMTFDFAGLNHLGWVRRVTLAGEDLTNRILIDDHTLRKLYPADLFDPALIRILRLIPTEYLFFYYSQRKAYDNQLRAGASRGEELQQLNLQLFEALAGKSGAESLAIYRDYLLRRNSSYMKLEAQGESAFEIEKDEYDPFETVTGYHRIALDVMTGLVSDQPRQVVVNVPNRGAIEDLHDDDVVEVPCEVDRNGPRPHRTGQLPDSVRGLVQSVKAYERTAIRAALERSAALAQLAMLEYPIVGQWELAGGLMRSLIAADPAHLGYLQ
jgi:6-phospho-beta-glucosidase